MKETSTSWSKPYLAILATIVLIRLATLGMPDLMDTTEGRYATTSQLMLERGDWVTPWIIFKGVEQPYLGKPPLHFWLINISYEIFGLRNFSARLPSVLSAMVTGAALFYLTLSLFGRRAAFASILVFSTSLLTFFLGGACLLDVTLIAGITLAIAGFSLADRSRLFGYLCFVGLGLGVLVKGPAGVVFFGAAVGPWVAIRWWLTRKLPPQLTALPWFSGIALFLAICIPWYIAAEMRNPGFLHYFLWNENIGRFFSKDYGDEYGSGHQQVRGAAWLMMIPSLVPWSVALVATLIEQRTNISVKKFATAMKNDQWLLLGVTWAISCPLLLLFARQYTPTYLFSSIPGFAFLAAMLWVKGTETYPQTLFPSRLTVRWSSALMGLTIIIASFIFYYRAPSLVGLIVALVIGVLILVLSFRLPTQRDALSSIGLLSLITAVTYGAVIVGSNQQLSTHRSTKNILSYAASMIKGDRGTIGFVNTLPFSARFYSSLLSSPTIKVSQVNKDDVAQATEDLLIVRGSRGENGPLGDGATWKQVGKLGRWRVYQKATADQAK